MICGTYGLSQTRRERAEETDESLTSCVHSELTAVLCVCVWWRAPFINQPSSSQVREPTGTLLNSNSLSSFIYQLKNPKEATQTDTLTDQKWTPVSRCGTTLNARREGGGGSTIGGGYLALEVVLSNCIPCARWWGEPVVIEPRLALRAREQIRQECKKPTKTSIQYCVEHRSVLIRNTSIVRAFSVPVDRHKEKKSFLYMCVDNFHLLKFPVMLASCSLNYLLLHLSLCLKNRSTKT